MSLTFIAVIGILVGFLCLVIGFFMEDAKDHHVIPASSEKYVRPMKKKVVVQRRKAA
jgi:hypothetical protein